MAIYFAIGGSPAVDGFYIGALNLAAVLLGCSGLSCWAVLLGCWAVLLGCSAGLFWLAMSRSRSSLNQPNVDRQMTAGPAPTITTAGRPT